MNWLTQLIDRLFSWIPKISIVRPDENGVRITCGRWYRPLLPGLYLWWPPIQEIDIINVMSQIIDLREQSLTTLDGKSIAISGAVEYSIRDVTKAVLKVQDYDRSLPTLCLGKIAEYVESHNFIECKSVIIKEVLRKEIREHVNAWGIAVKHIFVTDNVIATTHRIMLHNITTIFGGDGDESL